MPVDRPTFSEMWYRVADLRPRLRSSVQAHRQYYRGDMWHVLQDAASNQFFRLNHAAYRFVALLDGQRTIAQVWQICNEQLGDSAPTQGEAIQLLGQLYTSNLLQGDLPPDAEGLLQRYRQRVTREVQGYLMNLLFIRIPLLDPDRFLDRTVGVFGSIFSMWGLVLWLILIGTGLYMLADQTDKLTSAARNILSPERLPLLYLSYVLVKVFHEFGHAFACKKFGRDSGSGGEVHVLGVMFLVFTPLPYVDASSSWALRSKWHRMVVGGAGMMVEMAIAAIAAIVWARTAEASAVHVIAYNVMFIGSVSTLLFNANPLLRYDGYYMLSDLLEIPNLTQRSREYVYYLVRRFVWNVRQARRTVQGVGERVWLGFYMITSMAYRIFISVAILLFVADALPFLGALLAVVAIVAWVLVPLGKFVYYLMANAELARVRTRAVLTSLVAPGLVLAAAGLIPAPDRYYVNGVVEPIGLQVVHAGADGFLEEALPSGRAVTPEGLPLARSVNPTLVSERRQWEADRRQLLARRGLALMKEPAAVQIVDEQMAALDEKIRRADRQLADLVVHAPLSGTWCSPKVDRFQGSYVRRGQDIGLVATMDNLRIRAVAVQGVAGPLMEDAAPQVRIRIAGRPDKELGGTIKQFLPAGQERLPSPALGAVGGGPIPVTHSDTSGTKAMERVFEVQIAPDRDAGVRLLAGQRVVIRFETTPKPYLAQFWRWVLQLLQRRFHI